MQGLICAQVGNTVAKYTNILATVNDESLAWLKFGDFG